MTEMVTSGSMSGAGKRSDGLLGESDNERRRSHLAPPVLYATALLFDSTEPKSSSSTLQNPKKGSEIVTDVVTNPSLETLFH